MIQLECFMYINEIIFWHPLRYHLNRISIFRNDFTDFISTASASIVFECIHQINSMKLFKYRICAKIGGAPQVVWCHHLSVITT